MMYVKDFFDPHSCTFTYLIVDDSTGKCAIIDSVLEFNQYLSSFNTNSADMVIDYIKQHHLQNEWILETHIHADHISAAFYLKQRIGGKIGIGSKIKDVLTSWVPVFNTYQDTPTDAQQFDVLFQDNDTFNIGNLTVTVWHTSGHTPACVSYLVQDAIFVGDTIFAAQIGTARCDFPGGNAYDMYQTIQRIYSLPNETRIFLCHDYPTETQEPTSVTTVGYQKQHNIHIKHDTIIDDYVTKRQQRDKSLAVPKLLYPAIQANMRTGDFGTKHHNGLQYIHIPINLKTMA